MPDVDDLEFVSTRLASHRAAISRLWHDPVFQELCEHLTTMCRLEADTPDEMKRITELRQGLEQELLEWLSRDSIHSNQRAKDNE